jgi:hypothetical protein
VVGLGSSGGIGAAVARSSSTIVCAPVSVVQRSAIAVAVVVVCSRASMLVVLSVVGSDTALHSTVSSLSLSSLRSGS